jgi:hypothetical protein
MHKTIDEWIKDNPIMLAHMMRGQVAASHLIILEEIRALQGRPFDYTEEFNRLADHQNALSEFFDLQYEHAVIQRLKEKRAARQRGRVQTLRPEES